MRSPVITAQLRALLYAIPYGFCLGVILLTP